MKRPTFFLSSTIFDFQDLRSALKFHLEERGCKVLASDSNDFSKLLDVHSYEACLRSIHNADYFILMIGSRVGGWYDKPSRVSITMREYREAYDLQKKGKIKIINFVRSDIWRLKEDRHELSTYLNTLPLTKNTKEAITNHPSKLLDDADFISAFINEIGRNQETKIAVQNGTTAPSGNWIHTFNTFRDIVDVIDGQLSSKLPMEDQAIRRLLRRELRGFIKVALPKLSDKVFSPLPSITLFHQTHAFRLDSRTSSSTSVNTKRWDFLSALGIRMIALRFHPVILPQAIASTSFLTYDLKNDAWVEGEIYEALLILQDEIRQFTRDNKPDTLKVIYQYSPKNRPHRGETIDIGSMELFSFLHLLDRWTNILELSRSLLKHLDGVQFKMPSLRPQSFFQGMQNEIDKETPTDRDIDEFVKHDSID